MLTTNDGAAAFLGEGATLGSKGEHWRAADGSHGVWRSYHPMEQVRVSWHASEDAPRSIVDLHLAPAGEQTSVTVRHEPVDDSAGLSARWRAPLDRLDALAGHGPGAPGTPHHLCGTYAWPAGYRVHRGTGQLPHR